MLARARAYLILTVTRTVILLNQHSIKLHYVINNLWYSDDVNLLVPAHDGESDLGYVWVCHLVNGPLPDLLLLQFVKLEVGPGDSCTGDDGEFGNGQRSEALHVSDKVLGMLFNGRGQTPRETDNVLIDVLVAEVVSDAWLRENNLQVSEKTADCQRVQLRDELERVIGDEGAWLVLWVEEEAKHRQEVVHNEVVLLHHLYQFVASARGVEIFQQFVGVLYLGRNAGTHRLEMGAVVKQLPRHKHSAQISTANETKSGV